MPSGIPSAPYPHRTPASETRRTPFRARPQTFRVDRLLVRDVSPTESALLKERARRLVDPRAQHRLASSIDHLLARARHSPRGLVEAPHVAISARQVMRNRPLFERIAELLRRPTPPLDEGIAMTSLLLHDGRSALYATDDPRDLRAALRGTIGALER